MQLDVFGFAFRVVDGNLFEEWHKRNLVQQFLVIFRVLVTLRRTVMIVERHARADHIEHRSSAMTQRSFQQGHHLLGIAGKRARHEVAAEFDRHRAYVNRRQIVHDPAFRL